MGYDKNGTVTAGIDVREMYVKDSVNTIDKPQSLSPMEMRYLKTYVKKLSSVPNIPDDEFFTKRKGKYIFYYTGMKSNPTLRALIDTEEDLIYPYWNGVGSSKGKTSYSIDSKTIDSSKGRQVNVLANQYLKEHGKNNSVGDYDKAVFGVVSLLKETLLEGDKLKQAVYHEMDRLMKKYALDSMPQTYTFTIKQGANMKKVEISAKSYQEALKKVKAEAIKYAGKKVASKFDGNKLDTRDK